MGSTQVPYLLSIKATAAAVAMPPTTLREAVSRGDFPPPVQIGPRRVAFRAADIQSWVESRPVAISAMSADKGAAA